jgi:hypothetical protein
VADKNELSPRAKARAIYRLTQLAGKAAVNVAVAEQEGDPAVARASLDDARARLREALELASDERQSNENSQNRD